MAKRPTAKTDMTLVELTDRLERAGITATPRVFEKTVVVYLGRLPTAIPKGMVLVHNHSLPPRRRFDQGFHAWLRFPDDKELEPCGCDWAPELRRHYRVRRAWDEMRKSVGGQAFDERTLHAVLRARARQHAQRERQVSNALAERQEQQGIRQRERQQERIRQREHVKRIEASRAPRAIRVREDD